MVIAFTVVRDHPVLVFRNSLLFNVGSLTAMPQTLDPLPLGGSDPILCCYVNATSQIQIARITNVPNWYFERVVFPGQRLLFEAMANAQLEIHTGMMASAILSDTIPCSSLMVSEEGEDEPFSKPLGLAMASTDS
ncbi:DUF1830 domain-containing protein [Cyanobacteria bacterium FACHB-DQ100]|nr:DUF1830 domain-containing protein [Cyanobacteria bacterium FACHB-DQ100]